MDEKKVKENLRTFILSDLFFYVLEVIKGTQILMDDKAQEKLKKHGEEFIKNLTKLINFEKEHEEG